MKAEELDKKFDEGEDISSYLDISIARRSQQDQKLCAEADYQGLACRTVAEGGIILNR